MPHLHGGHVLLRHAHVQEEQAYRRLQGLRGGWKLVLYNIAASEEFCWQVLLGDTPIVGRQSLHGTTATHKYSSQ